MLRTSTVALRAAGDGAPDQEQVALGVDLDDVEAALGDPLAAHPPGIPMPLKTRAGSALAPIEPGARTLWEPWVTGPREKLWRLIVPWKPLPIETRRDLDLLAGLEVARR